MTSNKHHSLIHPIKPKNKMMLFLAFHYNQICCLSHRQLETELASVLLQGAVAEPSLSPQHHQSSSITSSIQFPQPPPPPPPPSPPPPSTMSLLAPSMLASPFQLLEINIISAQDLSLVSKSIKAYAVAWLNPERKLTTQADPHGHNNPTWNEKFVFRVEDDFIQSEDSVIMVEIYASAWLRDILIGTVAVQVNNLLPRSGNRKSKIRFVALQVRRPSGRPQGILNIGINLVDATMRSMPMYSELSSSSIEYDDIRNPKKHNQNENCNYDSKMMTLQRSQSEKNDSTINDYTYNPDEKNGYYGESESEIGVPTGKKGVIMNANGSLCSDVGPSPSVVAAAIAKGLYPLPMQMPRKAVNRSPMFEKWPPEKDQGGETLNMRVDRWRAIELPGAYDNNNNNGEKNMVKQTGKGKGKNGRQGNGLFSCFGTVLGCEISITCGGGNNKKRFDGKKSHGVTASELTYESSYV